VDLVWLPRRHHRRRRSLAANSKGLGSINLTAIRDRLLGVLSSTPRAAASGTLRQGQRTQRGTVEPARRQRVGQESGATQEIPRCFRQSSCLSLRVARNECPCQHSGNRTRPAELCILHHDPGPTRRCGVRRTSRACNPLPERRRKPRGNSPPDRVCFCQLRRATT
jgi:hypothetical protein